MSADKACAGEGASSTIDCLLATVKEERDNNLRFCFRVITPRKSLLCARPVAPPAVA